jgi:hypothetical protein
MIYAVIVIVIIAIIGIILSLQSAKVIQPDLNPLIKMIEDKQIKEKKELIDSISGYSKRIDAQKKSIDQLESAIKSQDKKIVEIKNIYENKSANIYHLDADGVIIESIRYLSE